ncbi:hypothetical protein L1887_53821 [Cichorium endivia]|nr:hypothetical protein L1887_53821 [Cichorium endivia]
MAPARQSCAPSWAISVASLSAICVWRQKPTGHAALPYSAARRANRRSMNRPNTGACKPALVSVIDSISIASTGRACGVSPVQMRFFFLHHQLSLATARTLPSARVPHSSARQWPTMADKPNKLAFLSMQAPAGYVAGLGRGASGFTTRADIGPARLPAAPTTGGPSAPKGDDDADDGAADDDGGDDDEGRFQDPENETGLFAGAVYEKDDEEADRIWEAVDAKMDQRRRKFRDAREREERERARADKPQVQAQFADLKRGLSSVTEDEWAALADPGSATGKRRKAAAKREARNTRSFAISDTILVANRDRNAVESALTQDQMNTADGIASLAEIGEARNKIFSHQLDQASSSSSSALSGTATSIDPKGYLTELSSSVIKTDAEIGDIAKARTLLDSVIKTDPRHAPGWIAAARVEGSRGQDVERTQDHQPGLVKLWKELVNLEENPEDARILLSGAVAAVPMSIELWLALARLSPPNDAKKVLNEARKTIPTSHEIWIAAARLLEETEGDEGKVDKTVAAAVKALKKGGCAAVRASSGSRRPESVENDGSPLTCAAIVKATIELDLDEQDRRAVWVEEAQSALERGCVQVARSILAYTLREFPDRPAIWLSAVALEQAHGTRDAVEALLERAVASCAQAEEFVAAICARKVDGGRYPRREGGAHPCIRRQHCAISARPNVRLELVDAAVAKFPKHDKLYMMGGQLKRTVATDAAQGIRDAREYYARGVRNCPTSIPLWILASRLEEEAGLVIRARALLEKARMHAPSPTIWSESIAVEHRAGSTSQARTLLSRALQDLPSSGQLWALAVAFEPRTGRKTKMADALKKTADDSRVLAVVAQQFALESKIPQARKWFHRAVAADPDNADAWAAWYRFDRNKPTRTKSPNS